MRALSRKDFLLRLGGAGLAGTALLGPAGCGGRLGGNKEEVAFFTGPEETTIQVIGSRSNTRNTPWSVK